MLQMTGVRKSFPGVRALVGVDFRLFPGEIHALMGQNGAGKSTLIKVLTGVYPADAGTIELAGRAIHPSSPLEAQKLGVSTVYQEVNLCPNLSVAENIFAGRYPRKGASGAWRIDWPRMASQAKELLSKLNLDIDVTRLLASYSVAVQQMVAIARALSVSSRVLILDEPTSSLDEDEVRRLFDVLRQLRSDGLAILFVTHFIDQVYEIADRITVLRNGALIGEYPASELRASALIAAMVGREFVAGVAPASASEHAASGTPALVARGLGRRGLLHPTDLLLQRGEVTGLGGLLGSGRTELARLLFGLEHADSGELSLAGQPARLDDPAQAIARGVGLCPEDRKAEGIVPELSVRENIALALQARLGIWRFLSPRRQAEIALRFAQELDIKTPDLETPVGQLSGGNQQKVVLARWLATDADILILDEPTRGIDIAAKQEIMNKIRDLARSGKAVLFISSVMDEVTRLSDRIVVMRDRRKVGELPGGSTEQAVYQTIAAGT
ncbi:MAG TPA: sugar ABC transporter ATP-binding protein [Burkholderiaceae bacterium]|nr:sugar ABC transporter ATP-binding protein [Burkholderiaceae bacterium]